MTGLIAATSSETATAFVEIGLVVVALALLSTLAGRLGITAVPFYLIAGLGLGDGGLVDLHVSEDFIALGAEIGVLLLLLTLGLEYTSSELRHGLRTSLVPGLADAGLNFTPGLAAGLLLGWSLPAAVLLGGVTWVSSSGVISKVLSDLGRLGNRETPAVLNLLVVEDLAMAVYLPVVAAVVVGQDALATLQTVAIALVTVAAVLWAATRFGSSVSNRLTAGSNETLLLAVFGFTLVVGGLAQQLQISAAIGAFLVGLALSGPAQERASTLIEPLKDLFAAIFFLFFSFQIAPSELPGALLPAVLLVIITAGTKIATGWIGARQAGASVRGRLRAGTTLIARGEFSIVIASLGVGLADGPEIGSLAAAYVLLTAVLGPIAAKHSDWLATRLVIRPAPVAVASVRTSDGGRRDAGGSQ